MTTIKFCKACDNLMYPREDSEKKRLVYGCNDCDLEEKADSNIVYRKEIRRSDDKRSPVLNADPILPRTKSVRCPECRHGEAVFFQVAKEPDDGLTLVFICCNPRCSHRWEG